MNTSYTAITEAFKQYLQTLGFSSSACYNYPLYIATFLTYTEQKGFCHITSITTGTIIEYYKYLECKTGERTRQTYSTSHLNNIFGAIDKFMEFLHHTGMQNAPSPLRYNLENVRKKPLQILTVKEIQTLYDTIPHTFYSFTFAYRQARQMSLKLMLDLCYGLGLRRSEALNLKIKDINFEQKVVHIKQGKNYKDRFIPMSRKVYLSLQEYIYQYRRQFSKRQGYIYPFKSQSFTEDMQMLVNLSGDKTIKDKNPTPHTLRHSIATHLLQNGMDIENISRFLGHSTLGTTQLYTHIIQTFEKQQDIEHE
jgi:integrase/recombinase XerD